MNFVALNFVAEDISEAPHHESLWRVTAYLRSDHDEAESHEVWSTIVEDCYDTRIQTEEEMAIEHAVEAYAEHLRNPAPTISLVEATVVGPEDRLILQLKDPTQLDLSELHNIAETLRTKFGDRVVLFAGDHLEITALRGTTEGEQP